MMSERRRFIAGAVCPHCRAEDRIVSYSEDETNWIACVSCGFKQSEAEMNKPKPKEVTVRWPKKEK